jgi:hypothetical protein
VATITGGCFCGAIRWEANNVFNAGYCHCSICRRISGAPVFSFVHFRESDFRLTQGSPKGFACSSRFTRYFCENCGSQIYGQGKDWPFISVAIGALDQPTKVRPTMHQCEADRLPWFNTADDLPRYPTNKNIPHPRGRISPTEF